MFHEVLRERGQLGMFLAEITRIGKHSGLFRIKPRHEGRPARVAHRVLAVGFIKPHTPLCQSIHIGRMYQLVAIAAEIGIKVIHGNQKDIGLGVGF